MTDGDKYNPFSLTLVGKERPAYLQTLGKAIARPLESLFGLSKFQKLRKEIYEDFHATPPLPGETGSISTLEVVRKLHSTLGLSWSVHGESLARIPKEGPAILLANHPFGGVEATILLEIFLSIRPDIRFLSNFILRRIPETEEFCIYVDPFSRTQSARSNLQPMRESINWVRHGGLLCIFPSGTVSHWSFKNREVTDPVWSPTVGRIIKKTQCPVVPVFIRGQNNWPFQVAGMLHPMLRTALIPREYLNKKGKQINVVFGNPVPYEKLEGFSSDEEMMTYLRLRTYILGNTSHVSKQLSRDLEEDETEATIAKKKVEPPPATPKASATEAEERDFEPIADPISPDVLEKEINALDKRHLLVDSGEMQVFCARAKQVPNVVLEIGRLREVTFRAVQEGTGKACDVDRFDSYYQHLFIWNRNRREVVGAYRLGRSDQILRHFGRNGLYTSTLFSYRPQLLEQIGPALEVGRSFVRQEYQRSYTPLLLLWRGIGTFVVNHPKCRILFGPVSINSDYDSISRQLITSFLKANNCLPNVARLIRPRNPMPRSRILGLNPETTSVVVKDLNEVSELLKEIESRQASVPVLLKQYLKLGGRLIGFNLDPSFGDVLDGLIYVDLLETEPRLLERYMGHDGIRQFYNYHRRPLVTKEPSGDSSSGKGEPAAEAAPPTDKPAAQE